jgi:hypothetical protein
MYSYCSFTKDINKCRDMYDISILVDTHSTKQREKQWQHEWGYISRFSSHSSASRGVAVLTWDYFLLYN